MLPCQLCTKPHIFYSDFCRAGLSVSAPGELLQNVYLTLFLVHVPRPCRDAFVVTTTHAQGIPSVKRLGFRRGSVPDVHRRHRHMSVLNVEQYTASSAGTPA